MLDAFAGQVAVADVDEDLDRLSERKREVMRLIARGYAYKEVARELVISIKTVETHVSSVLAAAAVEPARADPVGGRAAAGLRALCLPSPVEWRDPGSSCLSGLFCATRGCYGRCQARSTSRVASARVSPSRRTVAA